VPRSSEELVDLLDLETIDINLFRGTQPDTVLQRVFGGRWRRRRWWPVPGPWSRH